MVVTQNITGKIKIIIIEDNIEAQNYLKRILERYFSDKMIIQGFAASIKDAVILIKDKSPDLVFMDIELEDGYSFEIFKSITEPKFEIIFVTAFDNFYAKVIERFLKLRFRMNSIERLVNLQGFLNNDNPSVMLAVGNKHVKVNVEDIISIEADGNYSIFSFNSNERKMVSKPLKYYEELFNKDLFFKAHRGVLVNVNYIKSVYKKESLIMTDGSSIHVSIRNKSKLSELIKRLS